MLFFLSIYGGYIESVGASNNLLGQNMGGGVAEDSTNKGDTFWKEGLRLALEGRAACATCNIMK